MAQDFWFVYHSQGMVISMLTYVVLFVVHMGLIGVLDLERPLDVAHFCIVFAMAVLGEISHIRAMCSDPGCMHS